MNILVGLEFPGVFIAWVKECITTISYFLVINGGIHEHFHGGRGIRQGDPLSPYLFDIGMEYIARLL